MSILTDETFERFEFLSKEFKRLDARFNDLEIIRQKNVNFLFAGLRWSNFKISMDFLFGSKLYKARVVQKKCESEMLIIHEICQNIKTEIDKIYSKIQQSFIGE